MKNRSKTSRLDKDIKDTTDEVVSRGKASGERLKRGAFGGGMTTSQKLGSHAKEIGDKTRAEVDRAKREMRHRK